MKFFLFFIVLLSSNTYASDFIGVFLQVSDERTQAINQKVIEQHNIDISYKALHIDSSSITYYWGEEPIYSVPYEIDGKTLIAYPGDSTIVLFMENENSLISTGFKYVRDNP